MVQDIYNLPISELSVGEFIEIIQKKIFLEKEESKAIKEKEKKYVYGINGLANLLGCSKTHAMTIKKTGILDKAIIQNGRKIIIDSELALTLFNKRYD